MFWSQFFIRSTAELVPCIWPLMVPCSVFLHQPLTLNLLFAASRVYFLKLTPVRLNYKLTSQYRCSVSGKSTLHFAKHFEIQRYQSVCHAGVF